MAEEGRVVKHSEKAQQPLCSAVAKDVKKRASLSEQKILELQDYFLTPGLHVVKVGNRESGRQLLTQFLQSLQYYSAIAVVSSNGWLMPAEYHDLYSELDEAAALFKKEALEEYILRSFNYDFLAIEGTSDLLRAAWFGRFEHLLIEYDIARSIPIILFMYE